MGQSVRRRLIMQIPSKKVRKWVESGHCWADSALSRASLFPLCHISAEYWEKRLGLDLAEKHTIFLITDR
jgi:hypothetical protein